MSQWEQSITACPVSTQTAPGGAHFPQRPALASISSIHMRSHTLATCIVVINERTLAQ